MIRPLLFMCLLAVIGMLPMISVSASETNGTIDITNKYAWSENAGWINFGTTEGNVTVTNTVLTGYAWGENVGWISLNCSNDSSCGTSDYKVANNSEGTLSGYAWGENIGWLNFNPTGGGVTINSSGVFSGYAWGENIGWIVFNCSTTDTCGTTDYKVSTDWRPQSAQTVAVNVESGGDSGSSSSSGPDPISEPDAAPVLGFLSTLIGSSIDIGGNDTITIPINTNITVVVKPVDADRLQSLTLIIGQDIYQFEPTGNDPNNPTYTVVIRFDAPGTYAYTLRADYGITDRKTTGFFLVNAKQADDAITNEPVYVRLVAPSYTITQGERPTVGDQLIMETEPVIVPMPEEPEIPAIEPGEPESEIEPLLPGEISWYDKAGLALARAGTAIGRFFQAGARTIAVVGRAVLAATGDLITAGGRILFAVVKAAATFAGTFTTQIIATIFDGSERISDAAVNAYHIAADESRSIFINAWLLAKNAAVSGRQRMATIVNPTPTLDPRIPDNLKDHRYEEVQIRIATAEGQPLAGAQLTLLSEPKEATTDSAGEASFQDVPIGEHTLKIAFGKFSGEQKLFFKDDASKLLVSVTPTLRDGINPLWLVVAALIGGILAWTGIRNKQRY